MKVSYAKYQSHQRLNYTKEQTLISFCIFIQGIAKRWIKGRGCVHISYFFQLFFCGEKTWTLPTLYSNLPESSPIDNSYNRIITNTVSYLAAIHQRAETWAIWRHQLMYLHTQPSPPTVLLQCTTHLKAARSALTNHLATNRSRQCLLHSGCWVRQEIFILPTVRVHCHAVNKSGKSVHKMTNQCIQFCIYLVFCSYVFRHIYAIFREPVCIF
jgi:hypothetical protein